MKTGGVALVTGASSGIGKATAERLARDPGTELVLVARREERLRDFAAALPCPASYVAADLTAEDSPQRIRAHVEERPGRPPEALLPLLRSSAPSSIVNVASTAGRVARARTGAYSASKFALIGWTDALQLEEAPNGVHVGLVMPGFIRTEGFPATELREKALTRWVVSEPS